MYYLNRYEVDEMVRQFRSDPVLGPAARTLRQFVAVVDANSDGWPYWSPAGRSAGQLMTILATARLAALRTGEYGTSTPEEIRKAYRPMKSFMTRRLPHVNQKGVFGLFDTETPVA